jgi:cell division transport system ATP-binding protein
VLMATHDDDIVNSMKRRVIELQAGAVIRDEATGIYTSMMPAVQPARRAEPKHAEPEQAEPEKSERESIELVEQAAPADASPNDDDAPSAGTAAPAAGATAARHAPQEGKK